MKKASLTLATALFTTLLYMSQCDWHVVDQESEPVWQNLHDSVGYVGMETCLSCHANVHETYRHTGMGQSFDRATKEKTAAVFDGTAVYDSVLNLYYRPEWIADSLVITEFRLQGSDTVHLRRETVDYIIGSGQHTNSHLCEHNGYLFQAPITYYTQSKKWDLAPGFEAGNNSRFTRAIGMECLTCHNGLPESYPDSEFRFKKIPLGIDCERCHGPGELHVRLKRQGNYVDTSVTADRSIVNPRRLSRELQMSLCQRCHLQGIAAVQNGKNWQDFKPGMHLSEVLDVWLPRFEGSENEFIMASQADRLRMSECFQQSEMTCLTCHHPHHSVNETLVTQFNDKCNSCHEMPACLPEPKEKAVDMQNCVGCHMPSSGSTDIPHVNITDHFIRKRPQLRTDSVPTKIEKLKGFIKLQCLTREAPDAYSRITAFLNLYEKFAQNQLYLDSARLYLNELPGTPNRETHKIKLRSRLLFIDHNYEGLIELAETANADSVDGWTAYRFGEAFYQSGLFKPAEQWYQLAVEKRPHTIDFQNKLAVLLIKVRKLKEAEELLKRCIKNYPKAIQANANLGYLFMKTGRFKLAETYLKAALALDPDHEEARANLEELTRLLKNK